MNLASIGVQSTGGRERTRVCEPRGVPLARDFPRCPPRGECAHRSNVSSMRRSVLSPDETLRGELKIQRPAEYFDELRGVSSGDETLCRTFDISSQTKSFLKDKLRMQK